MTTEERALKAAMAGDWEKAREILGGFGVEHVSIEDRECKYINTGDTYDRTLCCEVSGLGPSPEDGFWFGSWGDWIEQAEAEYCEESNVIRCGYCGEYTPMDTDIKDWRFNVCEYCGHYVDGRDYETSKD